MVIEYTRYIRIDYFSDLILLSYMIHFFSPWVQQDIMFVLLASSVSKQNTRVICDYLFSFFKQR